MKSFQKFEIRNEREMVYLSPDAELDPLLNVSPENAYVIGGLVDETGAGSLSKERAGSNFLKFLVFWHIFSLRKQSIFFFLFWHSSSSNSNFDDIDA